MNPLCERIEALLPAFAEGSLSGDDAATVTSHVDSCASCRESLAAFALLERSLVSRRAEIPTVDSFLPDLSAARVPAMHRHSPLFRVFRATMSVPGISILLVMWGTMFALSFRTDLANDITRYSSLERWKALTAFATQQLTSVTGGNVWTLTAVYVALTLAILGSMGAMTLRYIRR
jgi:predicted anti-sigma-YlaC factor YlaD